MQQAQRTVLECMLSQTHSASLLTKNVSRVRIFEVMIFSPRVIDKFACLITSYFLHRPFLGFFHLQNDGCYGCRTYTRRESAPRTGTQANLSLPPSAKRCNLITLNAFVNQLV